MYDLRFESKAGGARKMGSIGGCRLVSDIHATGVSWQFACAIARCLCSPPYPLEQQQQPDPRYGLETQRRIYDLRFTIDDLGSEAPAVRRIRRLECVGRWVCAGVVLGGIAALWVWSLYEIFRSE